MHSKHILRVNAESHSDARASVENAIEDWGNENNYWDIVLSICEDGTCLDNSGDELETGDKILQDYIKDLREDIKGHTIYNSEELGVLLIDIGTKLIRGDTTYNISKSVENSTLSIRHYQVKQFAAELYARANITIGDNFDIWNQDYKRWELDEFGLTDVGYGSKGDKQYLVIISMHS